MKSLKPVCLNWRNKLPAAPAAWNSGSAKREGVSVYGLGRFPVTLYYEQWIRLLDAAEKLREFIEENKAKLKLKDGASAAA
jgi:hypothetical protein